MRQTSGVPALRAPTADVALAVAALRRGGLVGLPTETVYGLGADAENPSAVARVYATKGRPADHPLIVHVTGVDALDGWGGDAPEYARLLASRLWPGPLTIVVPRGPRAGDHITGGQPTVGLRAPDHPIAQALLTAFGGGVAAPSANRFGRVSPTTAADVRADLDGDVDLVLDGGPCQVGVESTIVDCSGPEPVVLRLGGVTRERVEGVAGVPVGVRTDAPHSAPGTLPAHYSPDARVELVGADEIADRAAALLAEGARPGLLATRGAVDPDRLPAGLTVLDPPADADEYAHVLYARLREADGRGLGVLLAVPPAPAGIGAAVADRLRRAAHAGAAAATGTAEPGSGHR